MKFQTLLSLIHDNALSGDALLYSRYIISHESGMIICIIERNGAALITIAAFYLSPRLALAFTFVSIEKLTEKIRVSSISRAHMSHFIFKQ